MMWDKAIKKAARPALAVILLLFWFAWLSAFTSKVYAAEVWNRWGAAPYASSFAETCRKAPSALDGFGNMPLPVKNHFKRALGSNCKGGTEVWLTPHMPLEAMWSGGAKPHVMEHLTVGKLPVLESPDGRSYREGSVAETAKALEWTYEFEGKVYALDIPDVCFNITWRFIQAPVIVATSVACKTVAYTVKPGDEVRFAILARRRLPVSACWQLCDGSECSAPPSPCDTCDWTGPKSVIPTGFEPLHTGRYVARFAQQSLRFPIEVRENYAALCVEREGFGQSNSWVVQPTAWEADKTTVRVPYGGQEWPVWGRETLDMFKWQHK